MSHAGSAGTERGIVNAVVQLARLGFSRQCQYMKNEAPIRMHQRPVLAGIQGCRIGSPVRTVPRPAPCCGRALSTCASAAKLGFDGLGGGTGMLRSPAGTALVSTILPACACTCNTSRYRHCSKSLLPCQESKACCARGFCSLGTPPEEQMPLPAGPPAQGSRSWICPPEVQLTAPAQGGRRPRPAVAVAAAGRAAQQTAKAF